MSLAGKVARRGKHDMHGNAPSRRTGRAIGYMMPSSFIRSARASNRASSRANGQAEQPVQAPRMMSRRPSPSSAVAESPFHSPALRRRAARACAALLCLPAAALFLVPGSASTHAIVVSAQPAANSVVTPGEIAIRLAFNGRVDSRRSGLSLQRPDGSEVPVALTLDNPPGVLAARARVDTIGRWQLRWQVLSLDGHITRGEVDFSVRDAAAVR
jgi:methionine-rich copper-binding protein CopC